MAKKPQKKAKAKNPVKADPTRTATMRRQLLQRISAKMNGIASQAKTILEGNGPSGRWQFSTTAEKVDEFKAYIKALVRRGVLDLPDPAGLKAGQDPYWLAYIKAGYAKGAARAYADAKGTAAKASAGPAAAFGAKAQAKGWLQGHLGGPMPAERLKALVGRTLNDLEGVTDATATKLTRVLADGLVQGQHPKVIAKAITSEIGKTKYQAFRIARTEIIRAHAHGQLDAFKAMGVDKVGVAVEWATALGACELCSAMEGVVLSVDESYGMIPRHPQCRCAFKPANVGEDQTDQIRSKKAVQAAIRKSVKAGHPNLSFKKALKKTTWQGADTKISSKRPKSLV